MTYLLDVLLGEAKTGTLHRNMGGAPDANFGYKFKRTAKCSRSCLIGRRD